MGETPQHDTPGNSAPAVSVDGILAAEMEKLSLKEREKVYEDVHGVSNAVEETPELIAGCLEQLDREICSIKEKDAYNQAKCQSFTSVTNPQLRLAFLRYSLFDPKMAAWHLVQHFSNKLEMFGPEKLVKSRITLQDIGEAAKRVLEIGGIQMLPSRDSNGRAVVVYAPSVLEPAMDAYDGLVPTFLKAFWYFASTLFDDEETQKKGIVVVANMSNLSERHESSHRALLRTLPIIGRALPYRLACFHYCYDLSSHFSLLLLSEFASAARSTIRVRIRTHNCSHSECLYKLMSFGIPVQDFPFSRDGESLLTNHLKFLEKCKKKEAYLRKNPPIEGAVDLPSNHDVLWGRGKQIVRHPGNRLLHELVEAYDQQYNRLSKDGKTKLAEQIVTVVHGYSGRFLKNDKESGMWVAVSNLEAREKVAHRFRRNRAIGLKGGSTDYNEPGEARMNKGTDGGGKRPRMMFNGS